MPTCPVLVGLVTYVVLYACDLVYVCGWMHSEGVLEGVATHIYFIVFLAVVHDGFTWWQI